MSLPQLDLVHVILLLCIGVAGLSFVAALYFGRRSKKDALRDIKTGLKEIYDVHKKASLRMEDLEIAYSRGIAGLSSSATLNYSLAKQFLGLMERRAERVEELLTSNRLEDLFKAHKFITSPLENAGDHLNSIVFSTTILQIKPGEFSLAIDTMLDSVEHELTYGKRASSYHPEGYDSGRKRKFTIRGFVRSVKGDGNKKYPK
jgi:hypothetical protein